METTEYKIKVAGCMMPESYTTEESAIDSARAYLTDYNPEDVTVHYVSISGTSHSDKCVWPVAGPMYSENH